MDQGVVRVTLCVTTLTIGAVLVSKFFQAFNGNLKETKDKCQTLQVQQTVMISLDYQQLKKQQKLIVRYYRINVC